MVRILFIFLFCLVKVALFSQESGLPFIRNYPPEEYHGFYQNWAMEQDFRGVMYFGNGKAILEYNGKTWRRFPTEKGSTVLSLGKDSKGRIYVGGEGEIGYLAPDTTGKIVFVSLLDKIPEKERNFTYVWHTFSCKKGIYFISSEKIIRINSNNEVKIWHPENKFGIGFIAGDDLFVSTQTDLLNMVNDSLVKLNFTEKICNARAIFPYYGKYLVATRNNGLFLYDKKNPPVYFPSETDAFLKNFKLYKGIVLSGNNFAFATLSGGILIMSPRGKIVHVINKETGLLGVSVYGLFSDMQGELWAALENGISRIELSSPFTFFNDKNGLTGIVQDLKFFHNRLYAGTIIGAFEFNKSRFADDRFSPASFSRIPKINQIMSMAELDGHIIFSAEGGLIGYKDNKLKGLVSYSNAIGLLQSKYNPGIVYSGGTGRLSAVELKNGKWMSHDLFDKRTEDIYYLAESDKNTVWCGTIAGGVLKVTLKNHETWSSETEVYDTTKGVPAGTVEVINLNGKITLGSQKGIYSFNKEKNRFCPDSTWGAAFADGSESVFLMKPDKEDNLWMMLTKSMGYAKSLKNGKYEWFDLPFRRLKYNDLYSILPDSSGNCWIGGTNGIIRYDKNNKKDYQAGFHAIIRLVYSKSDTLFYGAYADNENYVSSAPSEKYYPELKYKHNAITFEFAAPSFDHEESNLYCFFLDGFDDEWSAWSKITKKEYTNIPEGTYTFRLKAKNIYGHEGKECSFMFIIKPPWYRTVIAYTCYILLVVLLFYVTVRLNSRRLIAANQRLEKIVMERTQEILMQKEEIETQRDEISQKNEILSQQKEEIEAQRDEMEHQRDIVTKQKNKIEEIHTELTDSIRYAERIQKAVLPDLKEILKTRPDELILQQRTGTRDMEFETFVLFKPKDIVSGDFYFFEMRKNFLLFAVVDCTGHGVPGGFMSMLGISFLQEIIAKEGITTAARVLDELRGYIIHSLQQKGHSGEQNPSGSINVKDGMDMAFCMLNTETLEMQFAGANNPCWIVETCQGMSQQLTELRPDKMPIGIHDRMDPFTNHVFQLHKGDLVYLMSDGYEDQFGGPNGKKFYTRNLKLLIEKNASLPMPEQKIILENTIGSWMNDFNEKYDQTDDITVLGLKI